MENACHCPWCSGSDYLKKGVIGDSQRLTDDVLGGRYLPRLRKRDARLRGSRSHGEALVEVGSERSGMGRSQTTPT